MNGLSILSLFVVFILSITSIMATPPPSCFTASMRNIYTTPARQLNVTYTNSYSCPIEVKVTITSYMERAIDQAYGTWYIGNQAVAAEGWSLASGIDSLGQKEYHFASMFVKPGETYSVNTTTANLGIVQLYKWVEVIYV